MRAIFTESNFGKRADHTTSLNKSIARPAILAFQQNANTLALKQNANSLAFKQRAILNVFEAWW